jgi:predicted metal-dependent peptidase
MQTIPRGEETALALSKARFDLVMGSKDNPTRTFYATLAMRLGIEPSLAVPTAATDGRTLFGNPDFILGLDKAELIGVLAHEVEHCVRLHMERAEGKDMRKWNIATDLHINRGITSSGFTLPKGGLIDYTLCKNSEEQTYYYLPEEMGKGPDGQPGGGSGNGQDFDGNIGGVLPAPREAKPGESAEAASEAQKEANAKVAGEWKLAAEQAAMIAKAAGTLPGHIEALIRDNRKPQVDWRRELDEFLTAATTHQDRTWSKPNRKLIGQGLYLPAVIREGCGTIVNVFDTSGSVPVRAHEFFLSEMRKQHEVLKPERLIAIWCDTGVQRVMEFGPDDEIEYPYIGGGGTYFAPGFDWIEENQINPDAVIYLTDLYPADDPPEPEYPVLWVCVTPDLKWEWGKTIYLDITKGEA